MRIDDRCELARFLIARVAPEVKANGQRQRPCATQPGFWWYQSDGLQFALTENVLLRLDDAVTSCTLDVWPEGGRKVFSVSWKPAQPWLPPEIGACKSGPWIERLNVRARE